MRPGVGLIARKLGMTQLFQPQDGRAIPVTVLAAGPCTVVQVKEETVEGKDKTDGYRAVQLGFDETDPKRLSKSLVGHFAKAKVKPQKVLREFRLKTDEKYEVGSTVGVDLFKAGDWVDVTGISKGKGFQGGMARWNWSGGPKSHGSMSHRSPGSIGASAQPSRVYKGQHLPGHMGDQTITTRGLLVVQVDPENHLILVRGAVPGYETAVIEVRKSVKRKQAFVVHEEPKLSKKEKAAEEEAKKEKGESKKEKGESKKEKDESKAEAKPDKKESKKEEKK